MKDIVVLFVQTPDAKVSAGEPRVAAKTTRGDKQNIADDSAQPLWTWFIENPRPDSLRSFNLPDLILANQGE